MRYNATIKYENKTVEIKVNIKAFAGTYTLPDFLKLVRMSKEERKTGVIDLLPKEDFEPYENGEMKITKEFLKFFAKSYNLPMKIVNLGHDETENKLASRLMEQRTLAGYTQEEIASLLGISRSTYAAYETGRNEPDITTLIKLATLYKISLDYLVGRY